MMLRPQTIRRLAVLVVGSGILSASGQIQPQRQVLEVSAHLQLANSARSPAKRRGMPPAVLWLKPLDPGITLTAATPPKGGYTLLQKNKMFSPHLLVVPAGSVVLFPNADPFFHNVFSLFDGKQFDLGLYEAGKTKAVTFPREGVSYIFCNIHSQMSAVVISLSTPLYSVADSDGVFHLHDVPSGDYEMRVWVEGERQAVLDRWVRRVRVSAANRDLGAIALDAYPGPVNHENKFGQPYDPDVRPPY